MANPTPYAISYSFTDWQTTNPTTPLPAPRLDVELENIATALGSTQSALADLRRSDGALQNGIVGVDALDDALKVPWTGGSVSAWAPVVPFASGIAAQSNAPATVVTYSGETYLCITSHGTTSSFDATKWVKLAAKGANGVGSGDMLAANNLSDVVSAPSARANLGAAPRVRPVLSVSSSVALTASDVGKTIVIAASSVALSLPSATATAGDYRIYATAAATLTSPVAGSIVGAGVSATASYSIPAGETLEIESDGTNWIVTQRTRAVGNMAPRDLYVVSSVPSNATGNDGDVAFIV